MSTFLACIVWMASVFVAWYFNFPIPGTGGEGPGGPPGEAYLAAGMLYGGWLPLAGLMHDATNQAGSE